MVCDLHCHSKISDGSMGVEEILALAKRRGVAAISITDHDAVVSSTRACIIGKRLGIEVIHGVEMSAYDYARNRKVHILGYLCDIPDRLEGACLQINNARRAAATEITRMPTVYSATYFISSSPLMAAAPTSPSNIPMHAKSSS